MSEVATQQGVPVARNALLSAVAQSAVMVAGGINAVIIGARYEINADTDGLFTAFAIYSLVVVVAASSRTALVPRLIDASRSFRPFNEILVSLAWFTPVIGALFLALGVPFAAKVSGDGSSDTVLLALLIFWPAAVAQLVAAIAAGMLGVHGDFTRPAIAYASGGVIAVVGFVALDPVIGLHALPVAVLAGSLLTSLIELNALRRHGWSPGAVHGIGVRSAGRWLWTLVIGAGFYLCSQAFYMVSLAVAASAIGTGAVTIYTYAYFGAGLITALTAGAGAFALAAPIADAWEGDPRVIEPVEDDVAKFSLTALAACAGLIATLGTPVIGLLLAAFTDEQVGLLAEVLLALLGVVVGSALTIAPLAALFAAGRYRAVLAISVVGIAIQAIATVVAIELDDSLVAIGAAASVTMLLVAWAITIAIHNKRGLVRVLSQLRECALVALPATLAYVGAWWLVDGAASDARAIAAGTVGTAVFAALVLIALPAHRRLFTRMFGSIASTG